MSLRAQIADSVEAALVEYINDLNINDKLYRSKIINVAMSSNPYIVDAQLTGWNINDTAANITDIYIQGGDMEIPIARTIVATEV